MRVGEAEGLEGVSWGLETLLRLWKCVEIAKGPPSRDDAEATEHAGLKPSLKRASLLHFEQGVDTSCPECRFGTIRMSDCPALKLGKCLLWYRRGIVSRSRLTRSREQRQR